MGPLMVMVVIVVAMGALELASADDVCRDGFYGTGGDICCQLCPAGTFLITECKIQHGRSTCKVCPDDYFVDIPNYFPRCLACKHCQPDEDITGECIPTSNRVCECKHGYYKPEQNGFCIMEPTSEPEPGLGPGSIAAIVVVPLLLLAAGVATGLYVFCKKKERWPWQKEPPCDLSSTYKSQPTKHDINQLLEMFRTTMEEHYSKVEMLEKIRHCSPELVEALMGGLGPLLNVLQAKDVLTNAEIDTIRSIAGNKGVYEAATELLVKMMNKGPRLSKIFWHILSHLTDDYPRLLTIFEDILQGTQPSDGRADESLMLESAT